MGDKPSYLGLLNAISLAESRAHAYLTAWADVTTDPDVRAVLVKVAAREGEHGMSFAKRINELGFELEERDDPNFANQMEIATSDRSDLEKAEALGLLRFCTADDEPDVFDNFFRDHSIDIRTGELIGRYIAEERDTIAGVHGLPRGARRRRRRARLPARIVWPRSRTRSTPSAVPSRSSARSCARRRCPRRASSDDAGRPSRSSTTPVQSRATIPAVSGSPLGRFIAPALESRGRARRGTRGAAQPAPSGGRGPAGARRPSRRA